MLGIIYRRDPGRSLGSDSFCHSPFSTSNFMGLDIKSHRLIKIFFLLTPKDSNKIESWLLARLISYFRKLGINTKSCKLFIKYFKLVFCIFKSFKCSVFYHNTKEIKN